MVRHDERNRIEDVPELSIAALQRMSVADLRRIAAQRGVSLHGCVEKVDIVRRVASAVEASATGAERLRCTDIDGDSLEFLRHEGKVQLWVNGKLHTADVRELESSGGAVRMDGLVSRIVWPTPAFFAEQLSCFKAGEPIPEVPLPSAAPPRRVEVAQMQGCWESAAGRVHIRGRSVEFEEDLEPAELEVGADGAVELLGASLLPESSKDRLVWSDGDCWQRTAEPEGVSGQRGTRRRPGQGAPAPPPQPTKDRTAAAPKHGHGGKRYLLYAVGLAVIVVGTYVTAFGTSQGGRGPSTAVRRPTRAAGDEGEGGDIPTPAPTPEPPATPAPTRKPGAWKADPSHPHNWNCAGRAQDDSLESKETGSLAECGEICESISRAAVLAFWTSGRKGRCRCYGSCDDGGPTNQGWDNEVYRWVEGESRDAAFLAASPESKPSTPVPYPTPAPTPAPTAPADIDALSHWRQALGAEAPPPTPRPSAPALVANLTVCDRGLLVDPAEAGNIRTPGWKDESPSSQWTDCQDNCRNQADVCACWVHDGRRCSLFRQCGAVKLQAEPRSIGGGRLCHPSSTVSKWEPHPTRPVSWDCGMATLEDMAANADACARLCTTSTYLGFWTDGEGAGRCRCWDSCGSGLPVTPNSDESLVLIQAGFTPAPAKSRVPCLTGVGYPHYILITNVKERDEVPDVVGDAVAFTPRECATRCLNMVVCECFTFGGSGRCLLLRGEACQGAPTVEDAGLVSGPSGCKAPQSDWVFSDKNWDCESGERSAEAIPISTTSLLGCQYACRSTADITALTFFTKTQLCHCYRSCDGGVPADKGIKNVLMRLAPAHDTDTTPAPRRIADAGTLGINDPRRDSCWSRFLPRKQRTVTDRFLMVPSFATGFATALKQQLVPLIGAAAQSNRTAVLPHAVLGSMPGMRSTACDPAYVPLRSLISIAAVTHGSSCVRTTDHAEWLTATKGVVDVALIIGTRADLSPSKRRSAAGVVDWDCESQVADAIRKPRLARDTRYWGGSLNWEGEAQHVFSVERMAVGKVGCVALADAENARTLFDGLLKDYTTVMVLNFPGASKGAFWWSGGLGKEQKRVFDDVSSSNHVCGISWPPPGYDRLPLAPQWEEFAKGLIADWFSNREAEFTCVHLRAERLISKTPELRPVKSGPPNAQKLAECFRGIGEVVKDALESQGSRHVVAMHDMGDTGSFAMTKDPRLRAWGRTDGMRLLKQVLPDAKTFCGGPDYQSALAGAPKGVQAVLAAAPGNCAIVEAAVCRQATTALRFGSGAHGRFSSQSKGTTLYASCPDVLQRKAQS